MARAVLGCDVPSALHEAPLVLIREAPSLVPRLAREALGIAIPSYATARVADADTTQVVPLERRADAVLTLEDERGAIVGAVVVEVQLAVDDDKHFSWPLYLASVQARYRCLSLLVVVTPYDEVAAWAARPSRSFQPPSALRPIVLGPAEIPRIDDADAAAAAPELALLSAFVHGSKPDGGAIVRAAVDGLRSVESRVAGVYTDLALVVLGDLARPLLEAMMAYPPGYQPMSDWAKKHYGEGLEKGRAEGIDLGRAEGIDLGRAEGIDLGRAEGIDLGRVVAARRAIVIAAEARGAELSATARRRIETCDDAATLERWLRLVVGGATEADVWPRG